MMAKTLAAFFVAGVAALIPTMWAQAETAGEEPPTETPAEERPSEPTAEEHDSAATRYVVETGVFMPQPVGAEDRIGSRFVNGALRVLDIPYSTDEGGWYRVGIGLPGEWGELVLTRWNQRIRQAYTETTPGQFDFGITETLDFARGVADDGFADGIDAKTEIRSRELRVNWRFPMVNRPRLRVAGFAGYRQLVHARSKEVAYLVLDPPRFPSLIDTQGVFSANLVPLADIARSRSTFDGRGLDIGVDLSVPLFRNRLTFEAGAAWALLRGDAESSYRSVTSFYLLDLQGEQFFLTYDELVEILREPDVLELDLVRQFGLSFELEGRRSSSVNVFDVHLGLRARVWRTVEIAAGFRTSRLDDVVLDLRPGTPTISPTGSFVFATQEETHRSIGYEGVYGTVAYRF